MDKAGKMPERAAGAGRAKRYSEATKRQVVEEIERGRVTFAQAQRQYGIAGSETIRAWQRRYGKPGGGGGARRASALAAAERRIGQLEKDKSELERALARVSVRAAALEALVEEAEAHYGQSLKKNFATEPSSGRADGSVRRGGGSR